MKRLHSSAEILAVLTQFDHAFPRAITARVADLESHARQLAERALVYIAERDGAVAGFLAFYANDAASATAFLTHIAVDERFRGSGIGLALMRICIEESRQAGMRKLELEVDTANLAAIGFYESLGFSCSAPASPESIYMRMDLGFSCSSQPGGRKIVTFHVKY